jgi:hypothetical protein
MRNAPQSFITRNRGHFPCDFKKACHIHWAMKQGWSLTKTALELDLNVGTVSHVANRHRHPDAFPVPIPGFEEREQPAA